VAASKSPTRSVIVTCAVTGAIHTPTMSPHLPITPAQIAADAIGAAQAGAAIVHLHARDPIDGRPSPAPALFKEFLPAIKAGCDAVINITTGGGQNMTVRQRLECALDCQPEMCSLNMGSMNFGLYPALQRYRTFAHEWEPAYLEGSRDFIFKNTFADIEYILEHVGKGCGTRFEFECYDVGHLYTLAHMVERKLVEPPFFVQTIFGILGGIGADAENLLHMRRTADKLFGDSYEWSVLAAGRHQMGMATMAATMGGNVRVGLEDSIYIGKGTLATSNAEQVAKIRRILAELSLDIAPPDEARTRLALKGAAAVRF
jgi:3,5-dioxohexanoate:acetyl-CoA acetone transferase